MFDLRDLWDEEQAAQYLGTSPRSLSKWRSTGEHNIPFVKIGKLARYCPDDLKAYVKRHTRNKVEVAK